MKRTITCIYASVLIFTFTDSNAQVPDWSSKIAAIVYDNCGSCHRAGSIAPFPLETYVDFTYNATGILESVNNRSMPPWPPDPAYRRLAHERILSANEIQLINDFINGGMPTGDLANAPSFPIFNNNSQVGVPDTVLQTSAYTVSMSTDEYRNFSYPSNFNSEKQFRAIEVIPGNLEVVHHVLMYWDTTGNCAALDAADPNPGYSGFGGVGSNEAQLIGAWVPGSVPTVFPDAFAIQIPANADIVLQFHYAEGTMGEIDSTKINFFYNTSPGLIRPVYFVAALNHVTSMTNGPLVIPANTIKDFHEEYTIGGTYDLSLLGVSPHMHLVGTEISSYAVTPVGDTIPFYDIPDWDFEWQGSYSFRNVIKIPIGTVLHSNAKYDNTSANENNPNNPPLNVVSGEGTGDEMMLTFFQFTIYLNGDENIALDNSPLKDLTGIEPMQKSSALDFRIFPNPAQEHIVLDFNVSKKGNYSIAAYDMQGKLMRNFLQARSFDQGNYRYQYSIEGLPAGLYTVVCTSTGGIINQKPFVKVK